MTGAVSTGSRQPRAAAVESFWWRSGMANVVAITHRELRSYFVSPLGWVIGSLLVVPVSYFGYLLPVVVGGASNLDSMFQIVSFLMLFMIPLFTMRLIAEEKKTNTLEVLLTSPVRDWELVVGKWVGSLVFFLATIAFTLIFLVLIMVYYQVRSTVTVFGLRIGLADLDYGRFLTGYVGVILLAGALCALGLLASSLSQNQIISAFIGLVVMLMFWYIGQLSAILPAPANAISDYLSGSSRYASFAKGTIVMRDVFYFLSVTAGALFLTTRVLESRRWR